ncbi:MAG TPA: hypothetical protein VKU80_13795 [Planctomycetota bacterium]|nr:hypothetical protein [Planctomycetota bacterium]
MSNIEDVLRNFRPAPPPEGFWDRVQKGTLPGRRPGGRARWAWGGAAAAALLFALLLALVTMPLRDPDSLPPQEALRRIRAALESSETACIKFTLEPDPLLPPPSLGAPVLKTGAVFLKQGNKLNLSVQEWDSRDARGVPATEARLVSDGVRIQRCLLQRGLSVSTEDAKAARIAPRLAEWFLRAGTLFSWPEVVDLGSPEQIRNLQAGPDSAGARVLSYSAGPVSVTLWYDPRSYKVLRRVLTSKAIGTVTETFQEYEFNEDMPDSLFVLAHAK